MKIIAKLVQVLSVLSYIVILLVLIVVAPMVAGYRTVVVLTGSMEPAYKVGSVIYYKQQPYQSIQEGDVITFSTSEDSQYVVTHRVIRKVESIQGFITKGDANATEDTNPIPYGQVKGVVMKYQLPYAGYMVQYVQNVFVIGAVVLILLAKIGVNSWEEKNEKENLQ